MFTLLGRLLFLLCFFLMRNGFCRTWFGYANFWGTFGSNRSSVLLDLNLVVSEGWRIKKDDLLSNPSATCELNTNYSFSKLHSS